MSNSILTLTSSIKNKLKSIVSDKRYAHILSVKETSCLIGEVYQLDLNKLTLAALLHDFAKGMTCNELHDFCQARNILIDEYEINCHGLLHAKVSRYQAQEIFSINDPEILNAISSHTTGRVDMSPYEEVIYIADYAEPTRLLSDSNKIITIAMTNLAEAVFEVITQKIRYVIETQRIIHPSSVDVYNAYHFKQK